MGSSGAVKLTFETENARSAFHQDTLGSAVSNITLTAPEEPTGLSLPRKFKQPARVVLSKCPRRQNADGVGGHSNSPTRAV